MRYKLYCSAVRLFRVGEIPEHAWPIVYTAEYNISFFGMEKLHPFDSTKWGNVFNYLKEAGMLTEQTVVAPLEIDEEELLKFHEKSYLDSLRWSANVASITEVPPVALLPNCVVQRKLLRKLRYQTGGTILSAKLALDRGWSINIGGGFHHCSSDRGGGFCAYADISGALKLLKSEGLINTALIIDLDAHQGNGHERDFLTTDWVKTLDVFNPYIYPRDHHAKEMKNLYPVELRPVTKDSDFLKKVVRGIFHVLSEYGEGGKPDIIAYNAGTDILEGDPLGDLRISPQGIISRDEIVFTKARDAEIPIFMVLSGGYQRQTARVIADSILNLRLKCLITCPEPETSPEGSRL